MLVVRISKAPPTLSLLFCLSFLRLHDKIGEKMKDGKKRKAGCFFASLSLSHHIAGIFFYFSRAVLKLQRSEKYIILWKTHTLSPGLNLWFDFISLESFNITVYSKYEMPYFYFMFLWNSKTLIYHVGFTIWISYCSNHVLLRNPKFPYSPHLKVPMWTHILFHS